MKNLSYRLYFEKMYFLRKRKGMSQKDVALECGWDKERYRDLENGKTLKPRDQTLNTLAQALSVDIKDIVLEVEEIPAPYILNFFNNAKRASRPTQAQPLRESFAKGIFAIDVDGVLLQGFDFSWKLIWAHCKYNDKIRKDAMQAYLEQKISYQEWVTYCVEHFQKKNLRHGDFEEITRNIMVIKNLETGIRQISKLGFVTAIVSGSIDCFLEERVPNIRELFDHIFLNRFVFDKNGALQRGEATPYDFSGKATCVSKLCKHYGFSPSMSVYVGDSLNDLPVAGQVGLTIACNSNTIELNQVFDEEIITDNMMEIVQMVDRWKNSNFAPIK